MSSGGEWQGRGVSCGAPHQAPGAQLPLPGSSPSALPIASPSVWGPAQAPPCAEMLPLLLLALLLGGSLAQSQGFSLQVQKVVTVQEGLCVRVPCTLSYPPIGWTEDTPALGYWFLTGTDSSIGRPVATNNPNRAVQTVPQDRFQLIGNPQNWSCSLLIREAQMEDSGLYFFRVERGHHVQYNFVRNQFFLQVTALTQKPDVYVPEILEPGRPVTVICVFNWNFEECPAPTFSWLGAAISAPGPRPRSSYFSVLTLTPRPQDHGTHLTCRVDFSRKGVSTERTTRLNVAYAPKDLVISVSRVNTSGLEPQGNSPHLEAEKGQFLRLLCAADGQPPATLSWALEDRVLARSHPGGSGTLELVLLAVKPGDSGGYTCRAENRLGSQSRTLDLSVQYAPENLRVTTLYANRTVLENLGNGTSLPVLEGQSLRLLCVTHSNPPARLSWVLGGQTLSPSQPAHPGILELPQIQMEHEGDLTCQAQNALGSQHVSLHLSVVYPPRLLSPSCSWEGEGLRCNCSSRAQPAPTLLWRLGEELLEGNQSNASWTVTSSSAGPWANSSLSLSGLLGSGLRVTCEAWNVHGKQSAAVLLLPDKGLVSQAFSNGTFLGTGVMTFLFLCLLLVMKTLRKNQTQAGTPAQAGTRAQAGTPVQVGTQAQAGTPAQVGMPLRPRPARRSTILDYINVFPNPGPLARNRKAAPRSPSRAPPPSAHSLESKKNQKELHVVAHTCPGPNSFTQASESQNNQEELHYATLHFSGLRPRETQDPEDTHSEYTDVKFH
ncbi:sialic acid-binding Ig-like lectin 10 isoform X2 [Lutra lutra]|uniref:sialic acid-binding Ig-like lectin 10 isoform X2 n=1 Tax=Lutra lutra TaxID=9657 RepID=UPI001FD5F824|nr:sialic acid-binding Ig-like lectin 10 isoform X2 [Lutra lutra]